MEGFKLIKGWIISGWISFNAWQLFLLMLTDAPSVGIQRLELVLELFRHELIFKNLLAAWYKKSSWFNLYLYSPRPEIRHFSLAPFSGEWYFGVILFYYFFWSHCLAYGILVPWSKGSNPGLLLLKYSILTTGPPGKSQRVAFWNQIPADRHGLCYWDLPVDKTEKIFFKIN